jgi:hypothetical protein
MKPSTVFFYLLSMLLPAKAMAQFTICYFATAGTGTASNPYIVSVLDGVEPGVALNAYPNGTDCDNPLVPLLATVTWAAVVVDPANVINAASPAPSIAQSAPSGISQLLTFTGTRVEPFKFSIAATEGATTITLHFMLVYATSKLSDVSLVLDVSGSMGIVADPTFSTTETRMGLLKTAANDFVDVYNIFSLAVNNAGPNIGQLDRLGVVYFTTTTIASVAAGTMINLNGDNLPASPVGILKTEIGTQTPQAMTAMGLGLNAGVAQLGVDAARTKNIVLFTDGIQNIAPLVDDPGASTSTLTIAGGPNLITGGNGLQVSVVGLIQTTTPYNALLSRIATAARGKFYTVTKASDVNDFFKYSLATALKNRSPQIVEFKSGTLANGQGVQTFSVNRNVKKVVLELLSADRGASFTVKKNGTDITNLGRFTRGNGYLLFDVAFPIKNNPSVISEGDWSMEIKGSGSNGYRTMAMVDDHAIKYTGAIASTRRVNSPLGLSMKLTLHGKPFTTAAVTAIVLKPGQDLGTLLATTPARKEVKNQVPAGETSPGNEKLQGLLQDIEFYKSLLPKEQLVTLTLGADSTYTGSFAATDVTGAYQVIYRIEGSTPQTDKLVRTEIETTVLELDAVDLGNSSPTTTRAQDTLKINFRPRSAAGLYLGPDYGGRIQVTSSVGTLQKIVDNVDGSYTLIVAPVAESVNPDITLTVLDQKVFEGKANDFEDAGKPWWMKYWWIWVLLIIVLLVLYRVMK